jgi:hypothetical protein
VEEGRFCVASLALQQNKQTLKVIADCYKCYKVKEGCAVREDNRESKLPAGVF